MSNIKIKKITIVPGNHTLTNCETYHFINNLDEFFSHKFDISNLGIPVKSVKEAHDNLLITVTFLDINGNEYKQNIFINLQDDITNSKFVFSKIGKQIHAQYLKSTVLVTDTETYNINFSIKGTVDDLHLKNGNFIVKIIVKHQEL